MDLLSGAVLLLADRAARAQNLASYPTGKRRFEVLGVLVFTVLMASLALQLVLEAARGLAAGAGDPTAALQIAIIGGALLLKGALWAY